MKGKPLEMSLLFDFYGETLTEKQRELFDLYYNEDLSLAEIAEHAGITRQGVRDSIKRAEHALGEMESKLGLVARYGDTERCALELRDEVSRLRNLNTNALHSPEAEAIADRMTRAARPAQAGGLIWHLKALPKKFHLHSSTCAARAV